MKLYQITKRTRHHYGRTTVTTERTITTSATVDEVIDLAKAQGADVDEVRWELNQYGCTISSIPGYLIDERTV